MRDVGLLMKSDLRHFELVKWSSEFQYGEIPCTNLKDSVL